MHEIKYSITEKIIDIFRYKDDNKKEIDDCEIEYRLAHLIINDEIFCNNGWWNKNWPKDHVTLHVNCNDIFAWGCSDAEDITHGEIAELYEMWRKDPKWGTAVWCIKKRQQRPQKPVEKEIIKQGIWDLDEILKG